jgi:hypothetical protein
MLHLLSDEDVNGRIIRGLLRRAPALDLVRAYDVGLAHTPDPDVLEWAAVNERVLLTADVNTMLAFVWERVTAGLPMPGAIVLRPDISIGQAIDEILLVAQCSEPDEMHGRVIFLPLP